MHEAGYETAELGSLGAVLIRYLCEFHASDVGPELAHLELPLLLLRPGFTAELRADPKRTYLTAYFHEPWKGILDGRPDTEARTIDEAGILLMDDQPDQVDEAIASFLAKHAQ